MGERVTRNMQRLLLLVALVSAAAVAEIDPMEAVIPEQLVEETQRPPPLAPEYRNPPPTRCACGGSVPEDVGCGKDIDTGPRCYVGPESATLGNNFTTCVPGACALPRGCACTDEDGDGLWACTPFLPGENGVVGVNIGLVPACEVVSADYSTPAHYNQGPLTPPPTSS